MCVARQGGLEIGGCSRPSTARPGREAGSGPHGSTLKVKRESGGAWMKVGWDGSVPGPIAVSTLPSTRCSGRLPSRAGPWACIPAKIRSRRSPPCSQGRVGVPTTTSR